MAVGLFERMHISTHMRLDNRIQCFSMVKCWQIVRKTRVHSHVGRDMHSLFASSATSLNSREGVRIWYIYITDVITIHICQFDKVLLSSVDHFHTFSTVLDTFGVFWIRDEWHWQKHTKINSNYTGSIYLHSFNHKVYNLIVFDTDQHKVVSFYFCF